MEDGLNMVKNIPKAQTSIRHGGTHFLGPTVNKA
jgi:hypothetical protein